MMNGTNQATAKNARDPVDNRRSHQRLPYTVSQITVAVMHPGGSLSRFLVACRDLSAGGIAFLHRGFLHNGTECQIDLPTLTGGTREVHGRVVRCGYFKSKIHEVGVAFDEPVDPRQFMEVGAEYAELHDKPIELPELQGRLLYVGTGELDFSLLKHQLQGTGLDLTHCQDSFPTLNGSYVATFDVIVCEVVPQDNVSGETIEAVRSAGFTGPIIAFTAERDRSHLKELRRAGANEVLLKPCSPTSLIGALSQRLESCQLVSGGNSPILSTLPTDSSLAPLIGDFIESVRATAEILKKATRQNDLPTVRKLCLELKGNGSSYGFKVLTDAAGEVVAASKCAGSVEEVSGKLKQLQTVCSRMQVRQAA